MSYSLVGAAPVTPTVSGETLRYPRVSPGVDLVLAATATGFKESLVLYSAQAPSSFVYRLGLQGLTPRLDAAGSVSLVDGTGSVAARMPAGYMEDSRFDPRSGGFTRSNGVTYALTTVDGGPALRVSLDASWLRDPSRVFPVTVDPTTTYGTTGDTYVRSDESVDRSGANELLVGTYNGGASKAYTFMTFDSFATTYPGAKMSAVSLKIFDSWAYTCTPEPFWVNPITEPWSVTGYKPYPGPAFGSAIGSVTADPGVACTNTSSDRSVGTWMTVPLSTATFQNWALGQPNYGLAVTASQTDSMQWKRFTSRNHTCCGPYLSVTYTPNVAPQVDAQYPPSWYAATTLTPELLVSAHDPDAWPTPLRYRFVVFNSTGTAVVADSGAISARNWVVPASANLRWGETYLWTVTASDGSAASASQKLNVLTTPVPQPLVTSSLAQNGGLGFDANVGNYTTAATDAVVNTVGPELTVRRMYNSLDPRVDAAFGAGWSSVLDMRATDVLAGGARSTDSVLLRYPTGQEMAFGRNGDGTFSPPSGRFATFTPVAGGGYRLVDKDGTGYTFTTSAGTGVWRITSIVDAAGRALTFGYAAGLPTTVTSASGRALQLTWSTPAGAVAPHVATVRTDPVVPGDSSSALTWSYTYSGDRLTRVCPPTSSTACTQYTYTTSSLYRAAVMDAGPHSYWRLGEASGTTAGSAVLDHEGTDNGSYTNVTLGVPGPLAGSTATAAGFNGISSSVRLPAKLVTDTSYQSIGMWFKLAAGDSGVLYSYQVDPVTAATTTATYQPALYVGSSGKLYGQFYDGTIAPMATSASVANGGWHFAVLTAAGNTQALYLDGALVGSKTGLVQAPAGATNEYLGAGFLGGAWPDQAHYSTTNPTGYATFFKGSIAEAVLFDRPLTSANIAALRSAGTSTLRPLTSVLRRSGNASATVTYDALTGTVTQLVDGNGGTWQLGPPSVSGSSQVYVSAVLAAGPVDYWRLAENNTADAINEVHGNTAAYNAVTLGVPGGPFADATVGSFDGTASYLALPTTDIPSTGPVSVASSAASSGPVPSPRSPRPPPSTTATGITSHWPPRPPARRCTWTVRRSAPSTARWWRPRPPTVTSARGSRPAGPAGRATRWATSPGSSPRSRTSGRNCPPRRLPRSTRLGPRRPAPRPGPSR